MRYFTGGIVFRQGCGFHSKQQRTSELTEAEIGTLIEHIV
jgi:hypothetical protein